MRSKRRVRSTLLVLLWVWAICVFVVVDLFRNVSEFDAIRPRAKLYRSTRYAAHKLIGEPYLDGDFGDSCPPLVRGWRPPKEELRDALQSVRECEAQHRFDELAGLASEASDNRVRIAALRALVSLSGPRARPILLAAVGDAGQPAKVRTQAARLLGLTGFGSYRALCDVLESDLSVAIHGGALDGLAELGTWEAVDSLLVAVRQDRSRRRNAAVRALGAVRSPEAAPQLVEAVGDPALPDDARAAACRALGRSGDHAAGAALAGVLADVRHAPEVRAEAVEALGRLGCTEALEFVAQACADLQPAVARQARVARIRISHVGQGR